MAENVLKGIFEIFKGYKSESLDTYDFSDEMYDYLNSPEVYEFLNKL
jgi:hypothetical protein